MIILDLWPESLGGKKLQKLWPFQCWRRLRDDHLKAADLVITECLFSKVYKCQTEENSRCLLAKRSAGGLEDGNTGK